MTKRTTTLFMALASAGCAGVQSHVPTVSEQRLLAFEQEIATDKYEALYDNQIRMLDSIGWLLARAAADPGWCQDDALRYQAGYTALDYELWNDHFRNGRYRYIPSARGSTVQTVKPGSPAADVLWPGYIIVSTTYEVAYEVQEPVVSFTNTNVERDAPIVVLEVANANGTDQLTMDTIRIQRKRVCAPPIYIDGPANAFTDGSEVYVTSEMVDFVESDDELAFVIAHEMAHIGASHLEKTRRNSFWGGLAAAALGGLAGGVLNNPPLAHQIADAGEIAGALRHSIDFEREADYIAVALLLRAGFDPMAGAAFWRRIAERANSAGYGITHPPYGARSIAIELSVEQILDCARRLGGIQNLTWDSLMQCG